MTDAQSLFRLIDAQDLEGAGALFAPDARFVMGNSEPLEGREAIVAGNKAFFAQVRGIRHQVRKAWTVEADTIAETDVTYLRLDGQEVTVPGVAIWQVDEDGLIADFRVFADHAAVFAP
jgi:ketosteroid isomerase-like protein